MRKHGAVLFLCLAGFTVAPAQQIGSCRVIHGRAHLYNGDGQLRVWNVGTHHDFQPDETSWRRVESWLDDGVTPGMKAYASPSSMVYLFGDFLLCPTEPYRQGAVQTAIIKRVQHRRYVPVQ